MTGVEWMALVAVFIVGPVGFVGGLLAAAVLVRDALEDWRAEFDDEASGS